MSNSKCLHLRGTTLDVLGTPSPFHQISAVNSDLRSMLLLWEQSRQDISISPLPLPRQNLEAFPEGGYYVLAANRGGENGMVVVFDAGPLGLPPLMPTVTRMPSASGLATAGKSFSST